MDAPAPAAPASTPAPAKTELGSLTLEKLTAFVTSELGERPFRATQIYRWLHQRGATSFDEMTDLSKGLREQLKEKAEVLTLTKDLEQRSIDGTIKYRWKTHDGRFIESVYMPAEDRKTLCVSTQVGCAMACSFCMTGTLGLKRNLKPAEILAQVHAVNREVREERGAHDRPPAHQPGVHGHGRAAPQLREPQDHARDPPVRGRAELLPPAHHRLHRRPRPDDRAVRPGDPGEARDLAQREQRRAARRR